METQGLLSVTEIPFFLEFFDYSKVGCLGLIKDLCVTLAQIPAKILVMEIVVADIPPKYGMILSHSWGEK